MTWEHRDPEAFAAGTVGQPGSRIFYLQSRLEGEVVSLKMEKQQVQALAEYLEGLLDDLSETTAAVAAPPLVEPIIAEWTVGSMGVAYDSEIDRIIVVAEELVLAEGEEDETFEPVEQSGEQMRFALTRSQVRAFIDQVALLLAGGRPPCQICGLPMNPEGHVCPRAN